MEIRLNTSKGLTYGHFLNKATAKYTSTIANRIGSFCMDIYRYISIGYILQDIYLQWL